MKRMPAFLIDEYLDQKNKNPNVNLDHMIDIYHTTPIEFLNLSIVRDYTMFNEYPNNEILKQYTINDCKINGYNTIPLKFDDYVNLQQELNQPLIFPIIKDIISHHEHVKQYNLPKEYYINYIKGMYGELKNE